MLIAICKKYLCSDAYQIIAPNLVPIEVLEKSGHISEFKDQIFIVSKNLALRPETAQSLFCNLRIIRKNLKGWPLKIHQIGRAYRNQKSTRDGALRKNEFEQLELEILGPSDYDFKNIYQKRLDDFFKSLNLNPEYIEVKEKPHYALHTYDLLIDSVQIGTLNYRGTHDLKQFSEKEKSNLGVYQISLGLDRIIHFYQLKYKK